MMSRREKKKDLKLKRELRQFMREIDKNVADLTKDITEAVKNAAECKAQGLEVQYQKALNQIKFCMNTRVKYVSLKMDLKMAAQLRSTMQIVRTFADSMTTWSKSVAKISKDINIANVVQNVESATEIIEEKNDELEELTSTISTGFNDIVAKDNKDYVGNQDAEQMVENFIAGGGNRASVGSSVNSADDIERIRKMLDGDGK